MRPVSMDFRAGRSVETKAATKMCALSITSTMDTDVKWTGIAHWIQGPLPGRSHIINPVTAMSTVPTEITAPQSFCPALYRPWAGSSRGSER